MSMVFCRGCGKEIHNTAHTCPSCGAPQNTPANLEGSEKRILPALLLCLIFGWLGVHRFYVGKIGTGILQILTLGGLGIWVTVDLILIVIGKFSDKEGKKLSLWV